MASLIEKIAESIGIIPKLNKNGEAPLDRLLPGSDLQNYPPPERWNDWTEYEATSWPKKEKKTYDIVPTTCFNCESACGLLAYVDKDNGEVRKFEGNPYHPGSRGRNCAKGPATINQITDPDRILYPLKRDGKRGEGKWKRVSWEEALDDIAGRLRKAIQEGRQDEVAYHVGRPGHEGYMDRVLNAWGVDGHNSHTNICSSGARFGYAIWHGHDRPITRPCQCQGDPADLGTPGIRTLFQPARSAYYRRENERSQTGGHGSLDYPIQPAWPTIGCRPIRVLKLRFCWRWVRSSSMKGCTTATTWKTGSTGSNGWKQSFRMHRLNLSSLSKKCRKPTPTTHRNLQRKRKRGESRLSFVEVAIEIGKAGTRFATHNWRSASVLVTWVAGQLRVACTS